MWGLEILNLNVFKKKKKKKVQPFERVLYFKTFVNLG